MRHLELALAAAALVGMTGSSVRASDLGGYKDERFVPAASWSGVYLGAGGGGGAASQDLTVTKKEWGSPFGPDTTDTYHFSGDGSGGFGSVQIGADYHFGGSPFVVGAFADFDWTGLSVDLALTTMQTGEPYPGRLDFDNVWTAGGRAGFLVAPNALLYGLVAYSHAEATAEWGRVVTQTKDMSFDGVTIGGGVDLRVHGNWFVKFEYRYSQYGSDVFDSYSHSYGDAYCPGKSCGYSGQTDVEPSTQTGRAVLTYKFGASGPAESLK